MRNNVAVRNIDRADTGVVKALGEHGVATVHEAQGRTGLLQPYLRPIYPGARIGGSGTEMSSTAMVSFIPGRSFANKGGLLWGWAMA